MSSQETVIRAFVASPGDVAEERGILEDVVREFNITWSQNFAIRIELLKWETNTFPAAGDSAQSVINEQIGDEYDLFIGIMWHRFGTPTNGVGSGAEDEFRRAWHRFQTDRKSVQIMFYFKDAAIAPSQLDLSQLNLVRQFKKELGAEGVYHWTFNEAAQFREFARIHLARYIQHHCGQLRDSSDGEMPTKEKPSTDPRGSDAEEELGLFDLVELGKEHGEQAAAALERMTAAMGDYSDAMHRRTAQVNELTTSGKVDLASAKKLAALAAEDMLAFVRRMEAEMPIFAERWKGAVECSTEAANLSVSDFKAGDEAARETKLKDLNDLLTSIRTAATAVDSMGDGTTTFRNSVQSFPRLSITLNKAQRQVVGVLDRLLEHRSVVMQLTADAAALVEELIARVKAGE